MLTKKKAIFLLGSPGSGKGILSEVLATRLEYYHLSSSGLGLEWIDQHPEDIDSIAQKKILEEGGVFDSSWILKILFKEISRIFLGKNYLGIILDGPPRVECEADFLYGLLKLFVGEENISIVELGASEEVIISRAKQRLVCSRDRKHLFSTMFGCSSGDVCPRCQDANVHIVSRPEDKNIRERLSKYKTTIKLAHDRVKILKGSFLFVDTSDSDLEKAIAEILRDLNSP